MALVTYTVELVRHERQTVTFTADTDHLGGADMQRKVAHAYANPDAWVKDPGYETTSLTSTAHPNSTP